MADLLADIGSLMGATGATATNSTSRKNNTELNMEDFLKLMIVQLTSQTIDDTMDTSEMMNQMVQMQMITAIANLNETSIQSYANSLVGKKVTIGIVHDNVLEERELFVYGTGTYNGQKVVFCEDGNMYFLSQIMAVGVLPDENGNYTIDSTDGSGGTKDPSDKEPGIDGEDKTPGIDNDDDDDDDTPLDPDPNVPGEISAAAQAIDYSYDGKQGVPADEQE